MVPHGILIIVRWAKSLQCMGKSHLLPFPHHRPPSRPSHSLPGIAGSLTHCLPQPAAPHNLSRQYSHHCDSAHVGQGLQNHGSSLGTRLCHVLHCFKGGGTTAAYSAGLDMWASDTFWSYITPPCTSTSPVALALASAASDTLKLPYISFVMSLLCH